MQVRNFLRSLTLDHGRKATKLMDVLTLAKRVAGQMEGGPAVEDEEDTEASMELYSKLNKHFPKGGTEEQVRAAAHFKDREIETSDRNMRTWRFAGDQVPALHDRRVRKESFRV